MGRKRKEYDKNTAKEDWNWHDRKAAQKMTKKELVAKVACETGVNKNDAEAVVNAALNAIAEALKEGDKVQLIGFGTFEVKERAARTGRNPQTGAEMNIPASKAPKFKAGKAFKDAVNA